MATNPFHTDNLVPNWAEATAILKGDRPGHEFHGNQYTTVAYGSAEPKEYAAPLREIQIDPAEKVTVGTDLGKVLGRMNGNIGSGFGYLGARGRDLASGRTDVVAEADNLVKEHAIKEGWNMAQLASFADSRAGRHFGDIALGTDRTMTPDEIIDANKHLASMNL